MKNNHAISEFEKNEIANMSLKKVRMPEQTPAVINKNFRQATLGYTDEMALEKAQGYLNDKN